MKSPTTMLVERAVAKRDAPADPFATYRAQAQAAGVEAVVDACPFGRRWSYGSQALASHSGMIGQLLLKKRRQVQAGGLPEHFLLVVTRDEVIAFEQKQTMRGGATLETRGEVARWQRSALRVESVAAGYMINVTLISETEGERVECSVGAAAISEDFVRLLGDPARQTPAVA